jgi:hypothetical protein
MYIGELYNGLVIAYDNKAEYWLVENGSRRAFPNVKTFQKMNKKVCIYIFVYVCMYVCMYICTYMYM